MIVLLSRDESAAIRPELAAVDEVTPLRVPKPPPAGRRDAPGAALWADRALAKVDDIVATGGVTAFVSDDDASAPFAWAVAERHPTIPVLAGQSLAARVITLLATRGTPVDTATVRDLLDDRRAPYPPLPDYLIDRAVRPPLVVSMVNNTVEVDSRVQKVARSLADLGYDSVLLGRSPKSEPDGDWYMIGGAVVLRVPVATERLHNQLAAPPAGWADLVVGAPDPAGSSGAGRLSRRLQDFRRRRQDTNRTSFTSGAPNTKAHRDQSRRVESGDLDPVAAYPAILDWAEAFVPLLTQLRPDVIHVHDPVLIRAAVRARALLERSGHNVSLVYDAHEWTLGTARDHALQVPALGRLETDHMAQMTAVVTVSPPIAEKMQEHFTLDQLPAVVTNSPVAVPIVGDEPDIRTDLGLDADVPLLVYSGTIAEKRGLDLALRAVKRVPGAHLALLSRDVKPTRQVLRQAREMGLGDQVHRVDYVAADQVPAYLRTADVGVIPFQFHVNSSMGLPTKFREFLLAGLPIVATDIGLTGSEVRRLGIGEVAPPDAPRKFADAISAVLSDPQRYRRAITPELQAENSWQAQERVLAAVYESVTGPLARPAGDQAAGVLIGGVNSAGQATAWAGALSRAGIPARSMELRRPENPFRHDVDVLVPRPSVKALDRRIQLLLREVAPTQAVVLESGQAIAAPEPGQPGARSLGFREAHALAAAGYRVGLIFHGSDLRRPDVHARTHRWSPFHDPEFSDVTQELRKRTRANHEQLASWEGPVMVSTPDLVRQNPAAVWVPVVVAIDDFAVADRSTPHGPPVVLHLPSKSMMKGSQFIDPTLQALADEGVIRYRREVNVPHSRVPDLLAESDIFVDQVGMGILGVATIEAMAAGAVVVTDPGPEALQAYGVEVPLVAIDPDTLGDGIRALAADADRWQRLSAAGPGFARTFHDGARSAAAMAKAMDLVPAVTLR